MTDQKTGPQIIRDYVKDLPGNPGVYRMLAEDASVLYIGKAKNLKNRVSNYVSPSGLSTRIMRMVAQTRSMEFILTRTEAEALLLEANLIKKHKPRYNILLRDDKSLPYILLPRDQAFPQITKHRGVQTRGGSYFGPFASAGAVNATLDTMYKAFLLRSCPDTVFRNRDRPCLQYQIKRCSAPCVAYVSQEEYHEQISQAERFLRGKSREVQEQLAAEMKTASEAMHYEKAAAIRDRISALTRVQHEHAIGAANLQDADIVALYREGDICCIQVFFFRAGQNFGNKSYFPAHVAGSETQEVITAFLGQFYANHTPPSLILVSEAIEETALLEMALAFRGPKVRLLTPERGEKRAIVDQAVKNAREALVRHVSMHAANDALMAQVGELFGMSQAPARIEVYDNSHISGTHMVGGMITAGPEGFEKNRYRRYTIRKTELTPGDDYAMLREVLARRFTRLMKEDPERAEYWPDLVLLDGGAGQLSIATQVFADLGVTDMPYAAIAKGPDRNAGREWFYLPGKPPFQLETGHGALHYLQRLRDEAHRFAVASHRIKRANALKESSLSQIPHVGALRKRALLRHFGSAREVEAATLDELQHVPGINRAIAEKIYAFYHP